MPRAVRLPRSATGRVAAAAIYAAVLGAAMGAAWWALAPLERVEVLRTGVRVLPRPAEAAVAADGWFFVCGVVAGILTALLAALVLRGSDPLWTLVALVPLGLAVSLVAWRVGVALGPPPISSLAAGAGGQPLPGVYDSPLRLSALGVLLAAPTASVVVYFAGVAAVARHDGGESRPWSAFPAHSRDDGPREGDEVRRAQ